MFNSVKANPDKSHVLLDHKTCNLFAMIDNHKLTNCETDHMIGITIGDGLKFNEHVSKLCRKASQKLHSLSRLSDFMSTKKRRVAMRVFILH